MSNERPGELTRLLQAADEGDVRAVDEIYRLAYVELRRLARSRLAALPPGQTLQPTALVHEAFVRLMGKEDPRRSKSRRHFYAAMAQAMRDIVIEHLRRKRRLRRGGGRRRLDADVLDQVGLTQGLESIDLIALEDALHELEVQEPRCAEVVRLRFWAGLGMKDVAELLEVSLPTAERDWRFARTYLHARLTDDGSPD